MNRHFSALRKRALLPTALSPITPRAARLVSRLTYCLLVFTLAVATATAASAQSIPVTGGGTLDYSYAIGSLSWCEINWGYGGWEQFQDTNEWWQDFTYPILRPALAASQSPASLTTSAQVRVQAKGSPTVAPPTTPTQL